MLGELRAMLRYERSGGGGGYLKGRRGAEAAVSSRGRRARPAPPPSLPHGGRRPAAGAGPAPPPPRPAALPANGGRTPQAAPPAPGAQAGLGPGPGPATARAAEGPQGPRARLGSPRPGLGPGPGRARPQRLPPALREGGRAAPLGALGALGRDRASGGLFPMRRSGGGGGVTPRSLCLFVVVVSVCFRHGGRPGGWSRHRFVGEGSRLRPGPSESHWKGRSPDCLVSGEGAGAAGSECSCGPRHAQRPCRQAPPAWPVRPGLPGEDSCHQWGKGVRQGASLNRSPLPPQCF